MGSGSTTEGEDPCNKENNSPLRRPPRRPTVRFPPFFCSSRASTTPPVSAPYVFFWSLSSRCCGSKKEEEEKKLRGPSTLVATAASSAHVSPSGIETSLKPWWRQLSNPSPLVPLVLSSYRPRSAASSGLVLSHLAVKLFGTHPCRDPILRISYLPYFVSWPMSVITRVSAGCAVGLIDQL